MTLAELIREVAGFGFLVRVGTGGPQLEQMAPGAKLPANLLAELKERRGEIVQCGCVICGRVAADDGDRERLRQVNPFCDLAKCPYRKRS